MSQQQPRRPVTYGDVFQSVEGELAKQPVMPRDAAMMQAAETAYLGQPQRGGPAAVMQEAAARNERGGFVEHHEMNNALLDGGVAIAETNLPGKRVIREAIAGQVMGEITQQRPLVQRSVHEEAICESRGVTIGEALEATALTAGKKPVEQSDAAAIQAAEVRATGHNSILPGGVAAAAQKAAKTNDKIKKNEDKTNLADILTDVASKLPTDRPAIRRDAEEVTGAEMRNDPMLTTHPAGVAASVAAAARLNQENKANQPKRD